MDTVLFTNDNNVSIKLLDHRFSHHLRWRDQYEVMFRRINAYLIKRGLIQGNIIDLGAWVGDNSMPWAKNIPGTVYAIDPSADNCEFIQKTCEFNEITNVSIIQTAVSDTNEILSTNDDIDHCSFVYGAPGVNGKNKVEAVSLDYLYEQKRIEKIGYIHLDVEGMEYKILRGSKQIIDECRPIISFEQHLEIDDYDVILKFLQEKNYTVFLVDEVLPSCRPDCRNSFAFPNEIYKDYLIDAIHGYSGKPLLIRK
jgi:FkbM family methyltransferase